MPKKKEKSFKDSFQFKLVLIIFLTTLSLSLSIYFLMFSQYHSMAIDELKNNAHLVQRYVDGILIDESYTELNTAQDQSTELYLDAHVRLDEVRRIANILYLYTAKQNESGEYIYVIDGLDANDEDFRNIGDLIEPEIMPQLAECLTGNTVLSDDIMDTEWGMVYVAYFPYFDDAGNVIGAIGMEFDCEGLSAAIIRVRIFTIAITLIIMLVFTIIAVFASKKISEPFYKKLAYQDALTGLPNRMAFEERMKYCNKLMKEIEGLSIVVYDLNDLKMVNDTLGHSAGDTYMKNTVKNLSRTMRGLGDTYRTGGDEFATIVMGRTREEIDSAINALNQENSKVLKYSRFDCAVGVATFNPELDKDAHDTLKRADELMYEHKRRQKEGDAQ